jgi:hypothetical protein
MPSIYNEPKRETKQRALIEDGQQIARIVQVIDFGLQTQRPYKGEAKLPAYEVYLTAEFPEQRIEIDGESKPMWKSKRLKLSSDDRSTCYKWYNKLDPKGVYRGEWCELIETPLVAFITHNLGKGKNAGKTFDEISDIGPVMKGFVAPPLENDPVTFDLTSPNLDVFNSFPSWIQNIIKENLEYDGSRLQRLVEGIPTRVTAKSSESDVDEIEPKADPQEKAKATKESMFSPTTEYDDEIEW